MISIDTIVQQLVTLNLTGLKIHYFIKLMMQIIAH